MSEKKIAVLIGKSQSSKHVCNYLKEHFPSNEFLILEEDKSSRVEFLKYRVRKLGKFKVFGQILFMLVVPKLLTIISKKRVLALKQLYKLNDTFVPTNQLYQVRSINSEIVKRRLEEFKPDVVIVNGTRIIRDNILSCVNAPFINTHVGITPNYRGVHGGYWALVNNEVVNFGVTVHLIDKGVDTGNVIYQKRITSDKTDNFITYPIIQLGEALPLLKKAIDNVFVGELKTVSSFGKRSRQYYHPCIWEYFFYKFTKGIS